MKEDSKGRRKGGGGEVGLNEERRRRKDGDGGLKRKGKWGRKNIREKEGEE